MPVHALLAKMPNQSSRRLSREPMFLRLASFARTRAGLLFCLCLLLMISPHACAQYKKILYAADGSDLTNPERGFYIPSGARAGSFVPLDSGQLRDYRTTPRRLGKASYAVKVSLIYRGYELDIFKDRPLSDTFLNALQKDFDAVRT